MEIKDLGDLKFKENKYLDFPNSSIRNEFLKQFATRINSEDDLEQNRADMDSEKVYLVGSYADDYNPVSISIFNLRTHFNEFNRYHTDIRAGRLYIIPTGVLESISIDFKLARVAGKI